MHHIRRFWRRMEQWRAKNKLIFWGGICFECENSVLHVDLYFANESTTNRDRAQTQSVRRLLAAIHAFVTSCVTRWSWARLPRLYWARWRRLCPAPPAAAASACGRPPPSATPPRPSLCGPGNRLEYLWFGTSLPQTRRGCLLIYGITICYNPQFIDQNYDLMLSEDITLMCIHGKPTRGLS